jgi:hypothetical protein
MVQEAVSQDLDTVIDRLFTEDIAVPEPPLKWFLDEPHPNRLVRRFVPFVKDEDIAQTYQVKYGETWVNAPLIPRTTDPQDAIKISNYREQSMYGWLYLLMNKENFTIREKMAMFWHNHFVVAEFRIPKMIYQYMTTIHENVVGSFKQLTKEMTVDPSMLLYLNGAENTALAPNENFARELLELFTIGKGNLAGPGDYTNYTEDDIREMAKVLTGWTIDQASLLGSDVGVIFYNFRHDRSQKQLSSRFNNATISAGGSTEYSDLIDVIFQQDEVSRFICRKLYRYFVHYNITEAIEMDVIEPMAQILRDNDYVIEPALRALLSSEHFYGEEAIGCMIKNPSDFGISIVKGLGTQFEGNVSIINGLVPYVDGLILDYYNALILAQMSGDSGMFVYNHPDVAGWKPYYQEPQYYRIWINTVTLPIRTVHSAAVVNGAAVPVGQANYNVAPIVNVLELAAGITNVEDPNQLIHGLADIMFPYGITEGQKDYLKEILIPGLPDFEWTVEYTDYTSDPTNRDKREAVENRLKALITALLDMPEAQLM